MILDPEYDAEHDKQLYNARKGFHCAQNGPQSGQKWLFVLYYSEYHSVRCRFWAFREGARNDQWNTDSMFLDPKYDAEHDKQLHNARKCFHCTQNGSQSVPKMALKVARNGFLCYSVSIIV